MKNKLYTKLLYSICFQFTILKLTLAYSPPPTPLLYQVLPDQLAQPTWRNSHAAIKYSICLNYEASAMLHVPHSNIKQGSDGYFTHVVFRYRLLWICEVVPCVFVSENNAEA